MEPSKPRVTQIALLKLHAALSHPKARKSWEEICNEGGVGGKEEREE